MILRINWRRRGNLLLAITGLFICAAPQASFSETMRDVDVAIVLAVDTSFSIDGEMALRQRDGHIRALRSKQVLDAIKSGPRGCIAITYIEWSGSGSVQSVLPWTLICDGAQAATAAARIEERAFTGVSRRANRRTSISYAIDDGSLLLNRFPNLATRKVIDISSNGTNNDGVSVEASRRRALSRGHVINSIVLSSTEPGVTNDLAGYYRESVIGGPGSFVIVPDKPDDYCIAMLRKLVQEIAGLPAETNLNEAPWTAR